MANELHAYTTSGLTTYAVLLSATGTVWNGSAWEAIASGNWTTYDIALTEATAGIYLGTMPAVAAGVYQYVVYQRAGATPAITDAVLGTGSIEWDGSAVLPLSTVDANVDSVLADTGTDGVVLKAAGLASDAVDEILDEVVEGTYTVRQLLKLFAAALFGKSSGGGTVTVVFRDTGDTVNRITATCDTNGNRTAVTLSV